MGRVLILVREKVQILKLSATLGKTSQITQPQRYLVALVIKEQRVRVNL